MYTKAIIDCVRDHPGCDPDMIITVVGNSDAAKEVDELVVDGTIKRQYICMVPHYYVSSDHSEYLKYKREIMEMDERSAAKEDD